MKKLLVIVSMIGALTASACNRNATGVGTTVSRNGFSVIIEEGRLVLSDTIHFEYDSDLLASESNLFLDLIAEVLNTHTGIASVRIEGHTDSHGTEEHNQDLAERRARVVADYLRTKGVAQELSTVGFGFTRPLCTAETPECDAENRRVEFIVTTD